MRKTLETLRNRILKEMSSADNCGFSSDDVDAREYAKKPGPGSPTWESYLYKGEKLLVILSFDAGRSNSERKIKLNGRRFGTVRLFLYDLTSISVQDSKQRACDALLGEFPKKDIYRAEKIHESRKNNRSGAKTVGHVLDLFIEESGNLSGILDLDRGEEATARFVKKVAGALKGVLHAAGDYVNRREELGITPFQR